MKAYKKVAKDFNLSSKDIERVYKSFWFYIVKHIREIPLKSELLSEEDFNKIIINFNIPLLGKLGCTYNKYKYITLKYNKYVKNKKHQTAVQ